MLALNWLHGRSRGSNLCPAKYFWLMINDVHAVRLIYWRRKSVQWSFPRICEPGQLSLAIPSWVGAISTSQRALMPYDWGVKAGMVHMLVAFKTVWCHCYTQATSEHIRDKGLIIKCYYKFTWSAYMHVIWTGCKLLALRCKATTVCSVDMRWCCMAVGTVHLGPH